MIVTSHRVKSGTLKRRQFTEISSEIKMCKKSNSHILTYAYTR